MDTRVRPQHDFGFHDRCGRKRHTPASRGKRAAVSNYG